MTVEDRKAKNRAYQRAYRAANRERLQAQQKAWRDANPERNAQLKREWLDRQTPEQKRAAYDRNRDKIVARATKWNREHKPQRAETARKYSSQEHVLAQKRVRNRSKPIREYSLLLLGDPCSYCGQAADHVDHIVPLARGGTNTSDNVTAACGACNRSKHARSLLSFLLTQKG